MPRLAELDPKELTAEQQRVYAAIEHDRRVVQGPYQVWLRVPKIAEAANHWHDALRLERLLEPRLTELMVLTVAKFWSAAYIWTNHEGHARKAGISAEVIEAIATGARPQFGRDDERSVYDVVSALLERRPVTEDAFASCRAAIGTEAIVEMVSAVGFYTTVAFMTSAFDIPGKAA